MKFPVEAEGVMVQVATHAGPLYFQLVRLQLVLTMARQNLRDAREFCDRARERGAILRLAADEAVASNEKLMARLTPRPHVMLAMLAPRVGVAKRRHHRSAGVVRCGLCGRGITKAIHMTIERGSFVHTSCSTKAGSTPAVIIGSTVTL